NANRSNIWDVMVIQIISPLGKSAKDIVESEDHEKLNKSLHLRIAAAARLFAVLRRRLFGHT
ncbi:hypothetical protein TELCIR_25637, partial [Teladorsagia circumcincta]